MEQYKSQINKYANIYDFKLACPPKFLNIKDINELVNIL